MIEIMNMRTVKPTESGDIKVDRSSVLGNPFFMDNEYERDEICDKYQVMFDKIIRQGVVLCEKDAAFMREIGRLIIIHKIYGKLRLFCWCSPLRCHAETIKQYLESVV